MPDADRAGRIYSDVCAWFPRDRELLYQVGSRAPLDNMITRLEFEFASRLGWSQKGGSSRRDCPLYNMRSKHDNPSRPRERYEQTCSRKYVLRNSDLQIRRIHLSLHPPCSGQVKCRYMQTSTLIQPTSFFRRGRGDDSSSDRLQPSIALMAFSERVAQDSKPPSAGVTSSSRDVLPSYPETRQVLRLTPILCGQACLAWFGWKSASLAKPDGVSLGSTGDISVAGIAMDGSCARLCCVDN